MSLLALSLPAKRLASDMVGLIALVTAGLICTAVVYTNLNEATKLRKLEQRSALARTVVAALDHDMTATLEVTRGAALMAETRPDLTAAEFGVYASRLLAAQPAIVSLQWEQGPGGTKVTFPLGQHDWTEPVHATISEAQKDAQVVGTPTATAPFVDPLHPQSVGKNRVALTVPVFQRDSGTQRNTQQSGFINALIDISTLAQSAAYQAQATQSELLLFDAESHSGGEDAPMFTTLVNQPHVAHHHEEDGQREQSDHWVGLSFGTRQWTVLLHPHVVPGAATPLREASLATALGLTVTALMAALLARSQASRRRSDLASAHEQALRDELLDEQYRLKEVVESTGVAIWEYDLEQRFLSVSERWHIVSGYSREDLGENVLSSWQRLVHTEDWPGIAEVFGRLSPETGERFEYEYRMRHKSGYWMWINSRAHVIERNPEGRPIKIAGINLEVTQQKEAEIRIQALNATLEEQMQEALARSEARATLGTLIASVSHEMATPMGNSMMTASTLSAQAVQFDAQLTAGNLRRSELAAFVNSVKDGNSLLMRNLERAVALLKNFRQVASDQASEQRRQFDLRQCLQEVLATLAPSLKRHSHRVVLEVPDGLSMDSYPGPLGQVIINLINNAYLHAFEGMEQGEVLIAATADDALITLSCTDNGRGIAAETLEKMFQPFFSTRIGRGGTGLGMSIVENLVKATLGGTLAVQSTVGQGTTVTITVPHTAPVPRQEEEGV